jgi:hypothetical protein
MSPDDAPRDLDSHAVVVDADTFRLVAELEVRQAIRLQCYVSLLAFQTESDPEMPGERRPVQHLVTEAIRHHVRGADVIGVTSRPPHLWLLLMTADLESLPAIIGRIAAAVNQRTFETSEGGYVSLSMGGACFPTTARDRVELFRQAEALSIDAREDRRRPGHRYRLAQRLL